PRDLAIGFWGDHRGDSPLDEAIDERTGIVGLVANQGIWIGAVDQRFCASQIVGLPWREYQVDGIAQGIDERVDFGGQSAARPPDRLPAVFFRAPALAKLRRLCSGHANRPRQTVHCAAMLLTAA